MTASIGPDGVGVYWTSTDILRAAALMVAEAGPNASAEHKAAVLSTIQNRAADPNFPSSPSSVMTQQNQYEPVRRHGGIDNIPDANPADLALAIATLDSYRATSGPAGALDDRHGTVVYFTNPAVTAQRGTSHPSAGNIFPEFNEEGHVFTGINTFNPDLAAIRDNAPIYSADAQELVNRVRNTPAYHQALESLGTTSATYAYLAQVENVNVASLQGVNMQIAQSLTPAAAASEPEAHTIQQASAEPAQAHSSSINFADLDALLKEALSGLRTEMQYTPEAHEQQSTEIAEPMSYNHLQKDQTVGIA